MQRRLSTFAFILLLAVASIGQSQPTAPAAKQEGPPPMKLKVGDTVPDFTLKIYDGQQMKDVKLSDYRGKKNVLLGFFIFAFTGG